MCSSTFSGKHFRWWDFLEKKTMLDFSPKVSVARACACGQRPLVLSSPSTSSSCWLVEKREREKGSLRYLGGRQGYTHLLSPLPITLLCFFPPFSGRMVGEWEKNIGESTERRRPSFSFLSSLLLLLPFSLFSLSFFFHPASIPPVWIP